MTRKQATTPEAAESFWVTVIEEARQYQRGIAQYCEDRGISHATYY